MAKAYYWTKTDETPDVYHWNRDCETGKQILDDNLDESDAIPPGREPCETC